MEAESENDSSSEDETTEYDQLLQVEKGGSILAKKIFFFKSELCYKFQYQPISAKFVK